MQVDSTSDKKIEVESSSEVLTNPARVVPAQEKYIKFLEGSRYMPIRPARSGFVLLRDTQPSEPEVLVSSDAPASSPSTGSVSNAQLPASAVEDGEPQPPQPFEFNP